MSVVIKYQVLSRGDILAVCHTLAMAKAHARRLRELISDPITVDKVFYNRTATADDVEDNRIKNIERFA